MKIIVVPLTVGGEVELASHGKYNAVAEERCYPWGKLG